MIIASTPRVRQRLAILSQFELIMLAMSEIILHYTSVPEDTRLSQHWGQLEFARTQELVLRHLPAAPGRILDIGGGSGAYAAWLGSLGYETHLVDLVPVHVERARAIPQIRSAEVGDARKLAHQDASFDVALLLGPLYHLTESHERLDALREAFRMLRRGGLIFAAAINRFASLYDGLSRGVIDDSRFVGIIKQDLQNGQHRNPTDNPTYFTKAFFHRHEDLREEVAESGFKLLELAPIEGPGWLASDFEQRWFDPGRRATLLELIRLVENDSAMLALSLHILAIAQKPSGMPVTSSTLASSLGNR